MSETSSPAAQPGVDCWRDGEFLVLRRGAVFSGHCCAECGDPISFPTRQRLVTASPSWFFVIFISVFLFSSAILFTQIVILWPDAFFYVALLYMLELAILAIINSFTVHFSLCARHLWLRRINFFVFILFLIAMTSHMLSALFLSWFSPMLNAILLAIWVMFREVIRHRYSEFSIKKIDGEYVWVKGCGEAFLASLPEISRK